MLQARTFEPDSNSDDLNQDLASAYLRVLLPKRQTTARPMVRLAADTHVSLKPGCLLKLLEGNVASEVCHHVLISAMCGRLAGQLRKLRRRRMRSSCSQMFLLTCSFVLCRS